MNPHIIANSPHNTSGHITKDSSYCYGEIDERLFDSYLDISGNNSNNKSNSSLFSRTSLSSSSYSSPTLSEEDSDSFSSPKNSVIGTGRKVNKRSVLNRRLNEAKLILKKEESSDSESDSQSDHSIKSSTKKSKTKKANVISNNNNEGDKKQKNLYKTELCRNWEETGHCRYGVKCQYAHGSRDLREVERHPKYKTQKCRTFHQTGSCPYGARCTFRHYDLPGDALEMKNLEKAEQKQQQEEAKAAAAAAAAAAKEVNTKEVVIEKQKIELIEEEDEESTAVYDDLSESSHISIFSPKNQKTLHQNWFGSNNNSTRLNGASPLVGLGEGSIPRRNMMMNQLSSTLFDLEDSLLPSNAESLLPHELLFDLESPEEEDKKPARCPLRDYVTLPTFSNFQMPQQQDTEDSASLCKGLFRPWLF